MLIYVTRRILTGLFQVLAIGLVTFVLLRLLPQDPASVFAGGTADSGSREIVARQLGLDQSLFGQLVNFLSEAMRGSLGTSWVTQSSVLHEIAARAAVTFQIVAVALFVSITTGTLLGYGIAASESTDNRTRRARPLVALGKCFILISGSLPEFWWGLVLIEVGYKLLGWFPLPFGLLSGNIAPPQSWTGLLSLDALLQGRWDALKDFSAHMVLPVLTICLVLVGPIAKVARESILSIMAAPYYLNLRAQGAGQLRRMRCVARNGGAPVVMLLGVLLGPIIGGAALVETIYSIDGLAHLIVRSILGADYPMIVGGVVAVAVVCIGGYIVADLLAGLLNPNLRAPVRLRAGGSQSSTPLNLEEVRSA